MLYDFFAEFYKDRRSEKPTYKTQIWGITPSKTMDFLKSKDF